MKENIQYLPVDAEGAQHTRFDQAADIDCRGLTKDSDGGLGLLARAGRGVEDASYARFRENAGRGRSGFAHVLAALYGSTTEPPKEQYEPKVVG